MRRDDVLFANEAFYLAFSEGNAAAMDQLWAEDRDVVCVHPGWPALTDRETVMESWRRILDNPDQPRVAVHVAGTVDLGDAMLVVCYEQLGDTVLVAHNVFVAGPQGPLVVAHQAGLCSDPPPLPEIPVSGYDA